MAMKKVVQIILLIGLFLNLAQQAESQQKKRQNRNSQNKSVQSKDLTAEQIAKKFLPSIVLIVCDDGKGKVSQGSGFFIRDEIILTNYHVIKEMVRGKAKTVSGESKANEWWIEKVLYTDVKNDLALLLVENIKIEITGFDNVPLKKTIDISPIVSPILKLSESDKINIGEKIYVLSNPEGLTGTVSQGIISSAIRKINDIELLQIDAPISSGSSGGAVLNVRGEVVGIATSSLSSGQNLNFAIPAASIKSFLRTYDSPPTPLTYNNKPEIPNGWLSVLRKPVIITEVISDNESQETNSESQTTKTEEKPKVTYEEITQDLVAKLKGSKFKNSEKSIQTVSNISFTGCSINIKTAWIKDNDITYDLYDVNLKDLKDVSFYSFSREITMSINLEFSKNIVERTEFGYFEAISSATLTKSINLPVTLENLKALEIGLQFMQLKGSCRDTQNTLKPVLKETTDWLTNTIESTKLVTNSLIYKYESIRFSGCNVTSATRFQSEDIVWVETSQSSLKVLKSVDVTKNSYGNWGIWLEFSRNFDVTRETFGYFGKKEYEKKDKITIFFDSYDKAKRVGLAFARMLELCNEETKEIF